MVGIDPDPNDGVSEVRSDHSSSGTGSVEGSAPLVGPVPLWGCPYLFQW